MSDNAEDSDYRNVIYSRVANAAHAELRAGGDRGLIDTRGDHELAKPRAGEQPPERLRGVGWRARLVARALCTVVVGKPKRKRGPATELFESLTYEWERVDPRQVAEDFPRGEEVVFTTLENDAEPALLALMMRNSAVRSAAPAGAPRLPVVVVPPCGATTLDDAGEPHVCEREHHHFEEHADGTGLRWRQEEAA